MQDLVNFINTVAYGPFSYIAHIGRFEHKVTIARIVTISRTARGYEVLTVSRRPLVMAS